MVLAQPIASVKASIGIFTISLRTLAEAMHPLARAAEGRSLSVLDKFLRCGILKNMTGSMQA